MNNATIQNSISNGLIKADNVDNAVDLVKNSYRVLFTGFPDNLNGYRCEIIHKFIAKNKDNGFHLIVTPFEIKVNDNGREYTYPDMKNSQEIFLDMNRDTANNMISANMLSEIIVNI